MQTDNNKLKVGKTYMATDTDTVFVATESDVRGAALAKSEHLYVEVPQADDNSTQVGNEVLPKYYVDGGDNKQSN